MLQDIIWLDIQYLRVRLRWYMFNKNEQNAFFILLKGKLHFKLNWNVCLYTISKSCKQRILMITWTLWRKLSEKNSQSIRILAQGFKSKGFTKSWNALKILKRSTFLFFGQIFFLIKKLKLNLKSEFFLKTYIPVSWPSKLKLLNRALLYIISSKSNLFPVFYSVLYYFILFCFVLLCYAFLFLIFVCLIFILLVLLCFCFAYSFICFFFCFIL